MATTVEILEQVRRVRQALQVASRLAWTLANKLTDMLDTAKALEQKAEEMRRREELENYTDYAGYLKYVYDPYINPGLYLAALRPGTRPQGVCSCCPDCGERHP